MFTSFFPRESFAHRSEKSQRNSIGQKELILRKKLTLFGSTGKWRSMMFLLLFLARNCLLLYGRGQSTKIIDFSVCRLDANFVQLLASDVQPNEIAWFRLIYPID